MQSGQPTGGSRRRQPWPRAIRTHDRQLAAKNAAIEAVEDDPVLESGRVVANQNMDGVMGMITAATDVLAFGYEHSNLSEAVDYAVGVTGTPVAPDPTPEENLFIRSDQYAFVREGIPAIWVQGGRSAVETDRDAQRELDQWIAERYHKPTDDLDQPFDLEGVRRELASNLLVTWYITNRMDSIAWDTSSFLYRRWVAR